MKVKLLVFIGCIMSNIFGADINSNTIMGINLKTLYTPSLTIQGARSDLKQLNISLFDKKTKFLSEQTIDINMPVVLAKKSAGFKLSFINQVTFDMLDPKFEHVSFNQIMPLSNKKNTYELSVINGSHVLTNTTTQQKFTATTSITNPYGPMVIHRIAPKAKTMPKQSVQALESDLLQLIYYLANPGTIYLANPGTISKIEQHIYKQGTPGYIAQQKRAQQKKVAEQEAYAAKLEQMIEYVKGQITRLPHNEAL